MTVTFCNAFLQTIRLSTVCRANLFPHNHEALSKRALEPVKQQIEAQKSVATEPDVSAMNSHERPCPK